MNLYEFIKKTDFKGLSMRLIRRFAIQILQALKFFRQHGIIHCDLKPENILLKRPNKSNIKVIDLGSSCFEHEKIYSYIQSRFYRAPEIMLGISYTTAIDMWSFGCILAELFTGIPLFPAECEEEQLSLIMETLSLPPKYILDMSTRRQLFFDSRGNPLIQENSRGCIHFPATKILAQRICCADPRFLDLISRCLEWDPELRITPEEGLRHYWILEAPMKAPIYCKGLNLGNTERVWAVNQNADQVKNVNTLQYEEMQVGKIITKNSNNISIGRNPLFIKMGKKKSKVVGLSLNNSKNMKDPMKTISPRRKVQPKKAMARIRLTNNALSIIELKKTLFITSNDIMLSQRQAKRKKKYEVSPKNTSLEV